MSMVIPEAPIWLSFCWVIVVLRLISRRQHLGSWKALQLDDYLIILAMCSDTTLTALVTILYHTESNLIPPGEDVNTMSKQEIDERMYGGKLNMAVEETQIITIWLVKACILTMYNRMTKSLKLNLAVKIVSIYVAVGLVVMEILYLAVWCHPFHMHWAISSNVQCTVEWNHLITYTVINMSSDLAIIILPMPLLVKVKLSLAKRVVLMGVFMVGVFTIIAAVLNRYYVFTHPYGADWVVWYLRESYTAIICANLPLLWAFVQRVFKVGSWAQRSSHQSGMRSRPSGSSSTLRTKDTRKTKPSTPAASTTRGNMNTIHYPENEQEVSRSASTGPILSEA